MMIWKVTVIQIEKVQDPRDLPVDFYLDKAPEPEFKPIPKGNDAATQVIDTELFDYDLEVEPILQTLVGKTLEQSRMELLEELEIEEFKQKRVTFVNRLNSKKKETPNFWSPKEWKMLKSEGTSKFKEEIYR